MRLAGVDDDYIRQLFVIEVMHSPTSRDVYTGRVLWKREFPDLGTFDIYYDATVDLKDIITGLRVLVNGPVDNVIDDGDVDGDGRVGVQEILYDLNLISEQGH